MTEQREKYDAVNWDGLLGLLAAPFPAEAHEKKKQGGAQITFISWHHYVARLNEIAPDWSMETDIEEVGGKLLVKCSLTINGITRCNYGDEDVGKDAFGTTITNAYAQAFKRAAAMFGVGLYLYDEDARKAALRPQPKRKGDGNGNKPAEDKGRTQAIVRTAKFYDALDWVCERTSHYMQNGEPNKFHALSAAYKEGFEEITEENLKAVVKRLLDRVAEKETA